MTRNRRRGVLALVVAGSLVAAMLWSPSAMASEPFIGQIMMFGDNFAPRGWALCNGQLLSISSNTALFSILGTTYGGDGRTTFGLPDLRGRVAMHPGSGPGLTPRSLGQSGGSEGGPGTLPQHTHAAGTTVNLTDITIPEHGHAATTTVTADTQANATLWADGGTGDTTNPAGAVLAHIRKNPDTDYSTRPPNVSMNPGAIDVSALTTATAQTTVDPAGTATGTASGSATTTIDPAGLTGDTNVQPFQTVNYIIALQGVFPSRN